MSAQEYELLFGGSSSASFGLFASSTLERFAATGKATSSLALSFATGDFEIRAEASLGATTGGEPADELVDSYWPEGLPIFIMRKGEVEASLKELSANIAVSDRLSFSIGRLPSRAGTMDLFPCVDFLSRTNTESLFSGNFAETVKPADIVSARFIAEPFYAKLSVQPIRPAMLIVEPSSPWFPRRELSVRGIDISFLSVSITEDDHSWTGKDIGYFMEIGGNLGAFDLSILAFSGWDTNPLLVPTLRHFSSNSIELKKTYRKKTALGISLSAVIEEFRLKLDAAYSPARSQLFNTDGLGLSWETIEKPSFEGVIGFEWNLPLPSALAFGEYKETIVVDDPGISSGLLASAAGLGLRAGFFDSLLKTEAIVIAGPITKNLKAPEARGIVAALRLALVPYEELELSVAIPFFVGNPDSALGSYASYRYASAGMKIRF